MPRRAKILAISMIVAAGTLSAAFGLASPLARIVLGVACAVGIAVILVRVPTRETLAGQRNPGRASPTDDAGER